MTLNEVKNTKIATCAKCCSQRVLVSANVVEDSPETATYTVSCPECHHNISARRLETAIERWNSELPVGEEDWATEVKVY